MPRRLDQAAHSVLDDLRAVVDLAAVLERDAALVDGGEQPEALGEDAVRLGGAAAARAQRGLEPAQDQLHQLEQARRVELLELGDEPVGAPLGHLVGQRAGRQRVDQAARHRLEPRDEALLRRALEGGGQQRGQVRAHALALDELDQVRARGVVHRAGGRGLLVLHCQGLPGREAGAVSRPTPQGGEW